MYATCICHMAFLQHLVETLKCKDIIIFTIRQGRLPAWQLAAFHTPLGSRQPLLASTLPAPPPWHVFPIRLFCLESLHTITQDAPSNPIKFYGPLPVQETEYQQDPWIRLFSVLMQARLSCTYTRITNRWGPIWALGRSTRPPRHARSRQASI